MVDELQAMVDQDEDNNYYLKNVMYKALLLVLLSIIISSCSPDTPQETVGVEPVVGSYGWWGEPLSQSWSRE